MAYDLSKISILVVEDNLPMAELIKSLLEIFGVKTIYMAKDGNKGYELFCSKNPDLVISDLVMKPTDGITFAQKIRKDGESPNPFAPIIMITAFSEKARIVTARDAGVTEILVKPFNARDLYKRLAQVIENPRKFVRARSFIGPDRRRKAKEEYGGPRRRQDEEQKQSTKDSTWDIDFEDT